MVGLRRTMVGPRGDTTMVEMRVGVRRLGALAGVLMAVVALAPFASVMHHQTALRAGRTMEPPPPKPGDDKKPKKAFPTAMPAGVRPVA